MASNAQIQTVTADYLDSSLYDDAGFAGLPRLSRGTLLTALSRAFDLAEGRRAGHAQRVAYIGVTLAESLGLGEEAASSVFFASLLHDVGMAACPAAPRIDTARGTKVISGNASAREVLAAVPSGGWAEVIEALALHSEHGAKVCEALGLPGDVALAVASHHDCWDAEATEADGLPAMVARIAAAADRVECMIDGESSPLAVRRRGPALVREMAGSELDPFIAEQMARLAARDDFWLGFYDNDLATSLMSRNYGPAMEPDELFAVLQVVSDVVDLRNGRSSGRGRRVAELSHAVALRCDMNEQRADLVRVAALVQDVGTLGVPVQVLSKPDILTIDEMSAIQLHPIFARDILSEVPGLGAAAWWVGCHHERIDGKGYPGMLEGHEVPLEAQVIGMCEAFEALTSDRPYRKAMGRADALEVLEGQAGVRFEAHLLDKLEDSLPAI